METSYQMPAHGDVQYDTPQPTKPQSAAAIHQRTYQACIPCRQRKVRCDLGSVDNPHDPPCVRCRRESKECYFSATRRKKKADGTDVLSDDGGDAYEIKGGRKRVKVSSTDPEKELYEEDDVPRTPGGSIGMSQPLRRPTGPKPVQYGEEEKKTSEETVGLLQATEVHGGHDALKLLFEAASVHGRKNSKESGPRPIINGVSPASLPSVASPMMDKANGSYTNGPMAMLQNDPLWKTNINPTSNPVESFASVDPAGYHAALKAWSRFRFVRAGWFTAKEAIEYIDYFHKHLSPLTPVVISTYQQYDMHEKLLTTEPMLTIVLLLIASRHMKLEGPGSVSRPYSIHQKLWSYLSGMVDRVLWGQEQFGGGFCGAGAEAASDVNPLTRKGLRTLGTIESLILLTEWHPRAMHFPPDEADEELMVPDEPPFTPDTTDGNTEGSKGIGGQRMDTWLEPCWRSDRLCWMLLGLSMSLAFEIGVFDAGEWQRHARSVDGQPLSAEELQAYDSRRGTVRNLLLVYVTQTSGRLGLTSMLPSNYSKPEDSALFKQQLGQHESIQETILHFWLRMAALMREGNQKIYPNKAFTRDLIRNGDYKAVLQSFQDPLRIWREHFDNCAMPKYMRHVLEIEYEYCRVYINALALQAVAERCANEQLFQNSERRVEPTGSAVTANGARGDIAIPPQTLAKLLGGDRNNVLQVGDAARNLLKVVVNGLYPGEYLRHAPVRTYFRIISASIVMLKSFSLGASESDVSDSLTLMDKTVEALRGCIVDDVHVASRFADLLDTLTQNLKPRLVRIAADGRGSKSRRVSHPGSPEPVKAPLGVANQKLQAHQRQISASTLPNQQQWPYGSGGIDPVNGPMPPSNPLYGISNDIYDLTGPDNNYSIMPPPSFVYRSPTAKLNHNMHASPGGTTYDAFPDSSLGNDQDWLTLPLDPIINMNVAGFNETIDVNQTQYGPDIGGMDMLEVLLSGNNNHFQ